MELIRFIVRFSKRTAILAIAAGIVGGACNTALLAVVNSALRDPQKAAFTWLIWIFGGFCILLPLMRFFSEYLLLRLGQDALFEMRHQLSRQILAAPLRRLEELGSARLLATLTDDVPVIANALLQIPILSINLAVIACSLIYLGWLSLTVLLAVLAFMALGIACYLFPVAKAEVYLRGAREHMDALLHHFRALTEGAKELKLHRLRRDAFLTNLRSTAFNFRKETVFGYSIYLGAASWGQTMGFVAVGLLVFALPAIYGTSLQVIIGYVIVILFIMTPLQLVMNMMSGFSRANIAIAKLDQLGLKLREFTPEVDTTHREHFQGRIDLIGITHEYRREGEDNTFTLGPIDLSFDPGELVILGGGNGSGKTTLAKLLVGLYAPEAGEIQVDGKAINDANREAYRQMFSVVFSDFYLFDSLLGIEAQQLDQHAHSYLQRLQLAHKVAVKDMALTTTSLSQGQRKRLALLTAYLEDRSFYVFDEWAADQDPLFKEVFYLQLLPELKARGKTVLVISHDERYYYVADRFVKLDYGMIVLDETQPPVSIAASGVTVS
jgi:putative ATP-binding cassette transporter